MPLTILFWNVRKNDGCRAPIVRLAKSEHVDIVLLAEAMPDLVSLVGELNQIGQGSYYEASGGRNIKVKVVSRLASADLELRYTDPSKDMSIWRVTTTSAVLQGQRIPERPDCFTHRGSLGGNLYRERHGSV